ncbi:SDR family oxidoreductase [Shewanella sp. Isolate11]|uniref:SDR family oxidoreductase n=1 Tax=Shewanella sp. Isolate11 TaxID=2908530 RepID=UPI001EFCB897|nr:SDR family oxidoreductase [Shewanella sp. Isolate11]MCG9698254.1 SDR family oxidoreductase [Shewanella sp. Isolate11]
MQALAGKVVIITGASEGIGRALAHAMAPLGCKLVLTARDRQRLDSLAEELANITLCPPLVFAADVTSVQECQQLIDASVAHFGAIDILVNNAGMTMWSRFDELQDLSILDRVMAVNYFAPAYLSHCALPHLKASQGQIVVVASVAGLVGVPTRSGYSASKHAVIGFFDSLRIELNDDNVAVTIICPDFVVSQIHKRALDGHGKPLGQTPMQESKIITAEQCAQMMLPAIAKRERMLITSMRGRVGRFIRLIAPKFIDNLAKKAIASGH